MSRRSPFLTVLLAVGSIVLVIALIVNSKNSFAAAVSGLKIWWEVVFPATLPFIVVSEVLMGVGVVHFVGVLLEPLMRPLFNIPGTGGFVLTMGFSSGYPVAAKLTTRLREQGSITRAEGERLVSFTTTGDPLFVIGAVAIGFFHSEQVALVLVVVHYLSAVMLGIGYRFHEPFSPRSAPLEKTHLPLPIRALQAMHRARLRDGRPIGKLMGDAVQSALHTLMMIGGFIVVFAVFIQLFETMKITAVLSTILTVVLGPFGFAPEFCKALIAGLFEVTLGAQGASEVGASVSLMWKTAIASAIVSWGGLSVHAQIASILSQTDIRVGPFMLARLLHAVLSFLLTFMIWQPLITLSANVTHTVPVFWVPEHGIPVKSWWEGFTHMSLLAAAIFAVLIIFSFLLRKARERNAR